MIPLAAPDLSEIEERYVLDALRSGYLTHCGVYEPAFEAACERFLGRAPCVATSSGTAALHIALLVLGIGPGDEVLVPDLTFGATAAVVVRCGAKPVLVDIDPETWGIDWQQAERAITPRTRAVITVHLYGEDCRVPYEFPVPIVEDACEAFGLVPQRAPLAAYSFYGNKVITTGEGGLLVGAPDSARLYRDGGFTTDYDMVVAGLNYRMTNLQAAIGFAQVQRAPALIARRQANAAFYAEHLPGRGRWLFVAETDRPAQLAEHLKANDVETRPVFRPLHLTQAFKAYAPVAKYEQSVAVWEHGLALPTGPHVSQEQREDIVRLINGDHNVCEFADRPQQLAQAF